MTFERVRWLCSAFHSGMFVNVFVVAAIFAQMNPMATYTAEHCSFNVCSKISVLIIFELISQTEFELSVRVTRARIFSRNSNFFRQIVNKGKIQKVSNSDNSCISALNFYSQIFE